MPLTERDMLDAEENAIDTPEARRLLRQMALVFAAVLLGELTVFVWLLTR